MQVLSVLLEEFLEKVLICKSSSIKKIFYNDMFVERSQGKMDGLESSRSFESGWFF